MAVEIVKSIDRYNDLLKSERTTAILFFAEWEQCMQVYDAFEELSEMLCEKVIFARLDAEKFPEICLKYKIEAVPTVIFFTNGEAVNRVDGVDVAAITRISKEHAANTTDADIVESLEDRLKALINKAPVMIFMKGDRQAARCGFSKQLIDIINDTGISYETFDILSDDKVRQGLKAFSDWPTYPQIYVDGELIGGLDIIKDLLSSDELKMTLKGKRH